MYLLLAQLQDNFNRNLTIIKFYRYGSLTVI